MKLAHSKSHRAFTLIEIMVAIAVFMFVIAAIYSTWALVMRATTVGQSAAAQAQRQRIAVRTIEDSLMCIQSFQASPKYYSFIVDGDENKPTLSFTSRLPDVFPRSGKFRDFDLRRLTYTLEPGDDNTKNLVLRQNPVLMDMDEDEQKYPLILARNVKTLKIECWDTNQLDWVTEWDNTNAIPPMVRIAMVLGGNTTPGASAPDLTVVRAFSMPSEMMPVPVQRGIGGPGGPNGPGVQLNKGPGTGVKH
jgi:prepilin-type N-terminal cleavage/methylation domain-containing protein